MLWVWAHERLVRELSDFVLADVLNDSGGSTVDLIWGYWCYRQLHFYV